jgi:hypothetical protein
MSTALTVINRYAAPFASGMCMAAATAVDQPVALAALVGLGGIFAIAGLEADTRFFERFTDRALKRCLGPVLAE